MNEGEVVPVQITDEIKNSFINYAMSVIVDRALPDVRDGLKPVQRRILYGMNQMGLASNRKHTKSAGVVGEVIGKYHPHGDQAIYDTLVRMGQSFSMRHQLIDPVARGFDRDVPRRRELLDQLARGRRAALDHGADDQHLRVFLAR